MLTMKPTVHLNGTSKEALLDQYHTVISALRVALEAMVDAEPHARDYYPQGEGAFTLAQRESAWRLSQVLIIQDEFRQLQEHVAGLNPRKPGYPTDSTDDVAF